MATGEADGARGFIALYRKIDEAARPPSECPARTSLASLFVTRVQNTLSFFLSLSVLISTFAQYTWYFIDDTHRDAAIAVARLRRRQRCHNKVAGAINRFAYQPRIVVSTTERLYSLTFFSAYNLIKYEEMTWREKHGTYFLLE